MRRFIAVLAVLAVAFTAAPAFANGNDQNGSIHHNGGNATATVGNVTATGGNASANGGTHIQTNTQTTINSNTNVNTNTQGQQQGQIQGQGQQQSSKQANQQSINIAAPSGLPMNTGVAVAPGLTAGGSQVCLGSFSVGLGGPGASVAFGKTVQDKGCAKRQLFILLYNTGDARAATVLDSLYEESMGSEPETKVSSKSIPAAMAETQARSIDSVQGQ